MKLQYILDRLKEQSTWRGIILITTAIGAKLEPDQAEAIIASGIAIVGLINVFRREKK